MTSRAILLKDLLCKQLKIKFEYMHLKLVKTHSPPPHPLSFCRLLHVFVHVCFIHVVIVLVVVFRHPERTQRFDGEGLPDPERLLS